MISRVTGIILAGGKNSRMGTDKSFILFSGKPLIEILIDKLSHLFDDLMIVTNKPRLYKKYKIRTESDILPERGPLGGIYTGLVCSKTKYNFIVACDTPFLNLELVGFMLEKTKGHDVVIPKYNDRFQPLCAVYSKNCIKTIEKQISKGNLKIIRLFKDVKVELIKESEIVKFDPQGLSFLNINTPTDYQNLKRVYHYEH